MSKPITIPSSAELRAELKARTEEVRALRKLLKLAEAAEEAALKKEQRLKIKSHLPAG